MKMNWKEPGKNSLHLTEVKVVILEHEVAETSITQEKLQNTTYQTEMNTGAIIGFSLIGGNTEEGELEGTRKEKFGPHRSQSSDSQTLSCRYSNHPEEITRILLLDLK